MIASSLVLLEAMQHALPIIASPVGAIHDIEEDGVNGTLKLEQNSEAFTRLMHAPGLAQQMGQRGKNHLANIRLSVSNSVFWTFFKMNLFLDKPTSNVLPHLYYIYVEKTRSTNPVSIFNNNAERKVAQKKIQMASRGDVFSQFVTLNGPKRKMKCVI